VRIAIVVLALLAAALLAFLFFGSSGTPPALDVAPRPAASPAGNGPLVLAPPASREEPEPAAATPSAPDPRQAGSPLAVELNAPAFDARHDVATLHTMLRQYLRILGGRQGLPIGNDSDLARAFTGHNPMKLIVLPPTHPALATDGRLRDRWGTPYFIHPRGQLAFEIRSAGPDRKLFTDDDLVENP